MQFDLGLAAGAARVVGGATTSPLPGLLNLLQTVHNSAERRAAEAEAREETTRRRDDERDAVLTGNAPTQQLTEQVRESELKLRPGSKALHRQELAQRSDAQRAEQAAFREALQQARTQTGGGGSANTSKPTTATDADVKSAAEARTGEPRSTDSGAHTQTGETPARARRDGTVPLPIMPRETRPAAAARTTSNEVQALNRVTVGRAVESTSPAAAAAARGGGAGSGANKVADVTPATEQRTESSRTPTTRPTAKPEAPSRGNFDANMERILRSIHTRIREDQSTAILRLDPPELGKLRMQMDLRGSQLTLQVDAQTAEARRLLSENLDTLRRGLEAAGIQLERVELRVEPPVGEATGESVSAHTQGRTGAQSDSARSQDESTGDESFSGTESPPGEREMESASALPETPLTESRVNVLA